VVIVSRFEAQRALYKMTAIIKIRSSNKGKINKKAPQ
jgi:hypothetical protein